MKTLSIIGIILFSLLLLLTFSTMGEMGDALDELESLGKMAAFGGDDSLTEFTDNVYAIGGAAFLSSIFGLVISIVGVVKAPKNNQQAA